MVQVSLGTQKPSQFSSEQNFQVCYLPPRVFVVVCFTPLKAGNHQAVGLDLRIVQLERTISSIFITSNATESVLF